VTGLLAASAAVGAAASNAVQALLDWVYPPHCYHCEQPVAGRMPQFLCPACSSLLARRRLAAPLCAVCGVPLTGGPTAGGRCITCLSQRRYFSVARAFVPYVAPVTSLMRSYKFAGDYFVGPTLLRTMLEDRWLPDAIQVPAAVVPIPLHPRRVRERGYDQALLLARVVAAHLSRPVCCRVLQRTRYTNQQSLLPTRRRRDNVRGAFRVRTPQRVRDSSVLLVDDVMTTGATAEECAKVLLRAGSGPVQVLTLARTVPRAISGDADLTAPPAP
jgi:ComF family protein